MTRQSVSDSDRVDYLIRCEVTLSTGKQSVSKKNSRENEINEYLAATAGGGAACPAARDLGSKPESIVEPEQGVEEMALMIKWSGKECTVRVYGEDTVAELMRRICDVTTVLPKCSSISGWHQSLATIRFSYPSSIGGPPSR